MAKYGIEAIPHVPRILRRLAKESNPNVRKETVKALAQIGSSIALQDLKRLAENDPYDDVREAARAAVLELAKSDKPTAELVREFNSRAKKEVKAGIVMILANRPNDPEAMQVLLGAVGHRDAEVRLSAVRSAETAKPQGWDGVFAEQLPKEKNREIRASLTQALTTSTDDSYALVGLAEILKSAEPERRVNAADEMKKKGLAGGAAALIARLKVEREKTVARAILRALGELGDSSLIRPIQRCKMAKELPGYAEEAILLIKMPEMVVDDLLALWESNKLVFGRVARKALSLLLEKGHTEIAVEAISSDSREIRQLAAKHLIGKEATGAVDAILAQLAREKDSEIRTLLRSAIPETSLDAAVRADVAFHESVLKGDESWEDRAESAKALGNMKSKAATLILLDHLSTVSDSDVQEAIRKALDAAFESMSVEEWMGFLKSEWEIVRQTVALVLAGNDVQAAMEPIRALLKVTDKDEQGPYLGAMIALGSTEPAILGRVTKMLNHDDWPERNRAGQILTGIGGARVAALLTKRLEIEDDYEVAETIIRALDTNDNIGDDVIALLRVRLDDPEENVRDAAREVLEKHQPEAVAALV